MNKNIIKYIITLYLTVSFELIGQVPSIRLIYESGFYNNIQPGNVWSSVNVVDVISSISSRINSIYSQLGVFARNYL